LGEQGARFGARISTGKGLQLLVRRHDGEKRVGPVGENENSPGGPAPISSTPRREQAERRRDRGQACLHHIARVVARFPLLEGIAIIQCEYGRMLGETVIEGGAGEDGGKYERKLTSKHRVPPGRARIA